MKLTTNMVVQICGIIIAIGTAISAQTGLVNGKIAVVIGGVVAVAQAVAAYVGHISNPDGTPATK